MEIEQIDRETVEERKKAFIHAMSVVADGGIMESMGESYDHKPSTAREGVQDQIEENNLPSWLTVDEDSYSRDEGDIRSYRWQIFRDRGRDILTEEMTPEEIHAKLVERQESEMPSLPQDGSKGQWRAAKKINIRSYKWFLGIEEGEEE